MTGKLETKFEWILEQELALNGRICYDTFFGIHFHFSSRKNKFNKMQSQATFICYIKHLRGPDFRSMIDAHTNNKTVAAVVAHTDYNNRCHCYRAPEMH